MQSSEGQLANRKPRDGLLLTHMSAHGHVSKHEGMSQDGNSSGPDRESWFTSSPDAHSDRGTGKMASTKKETLDLGASWICCLALAQAWERTS